MAGHTAVGGTGGGKLTACTDLRPRLPTGCALKKSLFHRERQPYYLGCGRSSEFAARRCCAANILSSTSTTLEGDATASPFFDADAHRRSGRLVPGKLIDSVGKPHDVGFLPLYPAPTDDTVVDPVVHGLSALHIHLVTPAVIVRVDEMLADESGQRLGFVEEKSVVIMPSLLPTRNACFPPVAFQGHSFRANRWCLRIVPRSRCRAQRWSSNG